MRLIDAKSLKRAIMDSCFLPDWARVLVNRVIDDQPTVDAVPVVRCRDCENIRKNERTGDFYCAKWDVDDYEEAFVKPDDFCSYGERRDENEI